jgi:hypothetical protein
MTASSVAWFFLLLYGQHDLIACPRAAAACIATRLGFLSSLLKGGSHGINIFETFRNI